MFLEHAVDPKDPFLCWPCFLLCAFASRGRAIWRETFGEEMPVGVAEGSWIDMDAIRDNAMREEFVSTLHGGFRHISYAM